MNSLQKIVKAKGVLTVGISGVTCGGKSSLTNILKVAFPRAQFICQDDFYYPDANSLPKAKGEGCSEFANWDSIQSLDMVSMTQKVQATLKEMEETQPNKSLLIIDGFLIFNYPPLAELCDLKYFITLQFEECYERRKKRTYNPPDPPGYFIGVAWPMYMENLAEMRRACYAEQIKYLDGTLSRHDNFEFVMKDVKAYFDSCEIP